MDLNIEEINQLFEQRYGAKPIIVVSPGRINLIGEHTDYNEGFVLPAAIDKAIVVAVQKRNDNQVYLYAMQFGEEYTVALTDFKKTDNHWSNYILGVADQLQKRGFVLSGFNIILGGNVPIGAGVSSSAAVECATVFALNDLFGFGISKMDMVKIAQKAEHEFAGVMCGIMDQFASMFGQENKVISLDCRSLEYEYFPIEMTGLKIVLLDTNVKHSLASSEYNVRREHCEKGVAMMKQQYPSIKNLRDATMEMLDECVKTEPLIYKRCKYVIEENIRLKEACKNLANNDIKSFGQKMFRTHDGLSKEYEVSCKELDYLVEQVRDEEAVLGARMMGGGFGGCTINLVKEEAIPALVTKLSKLYHENMGLELKHYVIAIKDGTHRVQ
jgi:galactokinase